MERFFLFGHGGIDLDATAHRAVRQGDLDCNLGSFFAGSERDVRLSEFFPPIHFESWPPLASLLYLRWSRSSRRFGTGAKANQTGV